MQVLGRVLLAGTGLFELAAAAGRALCGSNRAALAELSIAAPCIIAVSGQRCLLTCSVDSR